MFFSRTKLEDEKTDESETENENDSTAQSDGDDGSEQDEMQDENGEFDNAVNENAENSKAMAEKMKDVSWDVMSREKKPPDFKGSEGKKMKVTEAVEDEKESEEKKEEKLDENSNEGKVDGSKKKVSDSKLESDISQDFTAKSASSSSNGSNDSDKENVTLDMPIDLSTKGSSNGDVIMLSDDSDDEGLEKINGFSEPSIEELKARNKLVKRFQAELRNEEAKLVLLKKLRQSQLSGQLQEQNNIPSNRQQLNSRQHSQPPPLIRGSPHDQHQSRSQPQHMQARPAHSQPPQLMRGGQVVPPTSSSPRPNQMQGPSPMVVNPRMDRNMIQNQMRGMAQGTSSQNLMAQYRGQAAHQLSQQQPRVEEQTPAQRQAAAKLALRKQLEKTLLQIPPPKPPPPEMNFIPGLASPDFIYLLGLEEAVNYIIDSNLIAKGRKNPDEKMICNPFTCIQCGTDFTPVWKREKPGSKNVICEQCVTSNQKKALKQEHTNRLKSAFVKALQQEQEIERMQSQESKSLSNSTSSLSSMGSSSSLSSTQPTSASAAAAAAALSMSASYQKTMQETLRQHQNLLQAHQASLRMGLQHFNPRAGFPYQLPFGARASDLQKQYLLDLIPKGGMHWK
ncbi:hypothetical protein CHS0354_004396 [Potamilus streckersoni]|uniref:Transcriptional repressor p66-beta n=1 Tax=Potamilus streckersoni TaxID=2493646 RepID=A0AAE0T059_9BIVA|nr:hypothetical protein CHS0354_004396 [Potamilus streckersoni]